MMRWNGKGFIPGIPARDLTDAEVEQHGEKVLLASGLYDVVKPAEKIMDKPARVMKPEDGSG